MKKNKEELIKIFEETLEVCKIGGYEAENGDFISISNSWPGTRFCASVPHSSSSKWLRVYKFKSPIVDPTRKTKITVQNIDTFNKAKEFGPDCVVLNMASFRFPGGGVINGARAQEEDLFRRSNLAQSLYYYSPMNNIFDYDDWKKKTSGEIFPNGEYPIPIYGGIYTPRVTVFRSAESYSFLNNPFECAVISFPAIKNPDINRDGMMSELAATMMKGKIRGVLRLAKFGGHEKVVLGAWGCGAYKCPATHVAQLFKEVIEEVEFAGVFSEICFAIIEDANSVRVNGSNIRAFKEVFL